MNFFIWNILLGFLWVALTGNFAGSGFVAGFIFGYLVLAFVSRATGSMDAYTRKIPQVVGFAGFYMWELLLSNLRVAYEVVTPSHTMSPGVIGLPLETRDPATVTILANLISMTPGTLSIDVSSDQGTLYIHAMHMDDEDALRADLKELERRVVDLLS